MMLKLLLSSAAMIWVLSPGALWASEQEFFSKFSYDNMGLGSDFIRLLDQGLDHSLKATHERTQQQAQSSGGCKSRLTVQFLNGSEPLFKSLGRTLNQAEIAFSEGLFRLDSVGCLENASPSKVSKVYLSTDYRVKAIPQAVSSKKIGSRICDTTTGIPLILSGSNFCSESVETKIDSGFTVDTRLAWNDPNALEIYIFKSKMSTYESGDLTSFHFTSFVRGPNISSIIKGFATQNIKSGQAQAVSAMREFLLK